MVQAVVIIALMVGAMMTTAGPRRDVDFWWHVALGDQFRAHTPSSQIGQWTAFPGLPSWRSGQAWTEISMSLLDQHLPVTSYLWWRALTLALALITLSWATGVWSAGVSATTPTSSAIRRWPAWVAFLAGVWTVTGFTQERPQQISYICYPLAGALIAQVLRPAECTRLDRLTVCTIIGATALTTFLWVQFHQGWLLACGCLVLAIMLGLRHLRAAWFLVLTLGVVALAAASNPWGFAAPAAARHLAASSSALVEWQPTSLISLPAAGLATLLVGFVAVWVSGPRITAEIVIVLVLLVSAATAARGIAPAVLLAAPILSRHAGSPVAPPLKTQVTCLAALFGTAVWVSSGLGPAASDHVTDRQASVARLAAAAICQAPTAHVTIATAYHDSGAALYGARRSPCASKHQINVVLDGRADRNGATAISRWLAVELAHEGWWSTWTTVAPTMAILPRDSPLLAPLSAHGWRIVDDTSVDLVVIAPEPT